jgi:hypothetical protein
MNQIHNIYNDQNINDNTKLTLQLNYLIGLNLIRRLIY